MKVLLIFSILIFSVQSKADSRSREKIYAELIDENMFSECISKTWNYNYRMWFGATFIYSKILLKKKWLIDDFDDVIPGSLENIIEKAGYSETTTDVHRSVESALKECELRKIKKRYSAHSSEEINKAIERFLQNN